ncbi:hypothetical protein PENANT_c016G11528 [Penicillium antarcticum]|uniref:Uncharacterized protein n=1 Tax=Penicillium antarcticum TaxID=416450 RepID=A0A1V6Q2W6_9EURO|nr:hypothetical protein PENANT_c016G11528 [Penicillium antarcticum]
MGRIRSQVLGFKHDSKIEIIIISLSLLEPNHFSAGFIRYCTESKSVHWFS